MYDDFSHNLLARDRVAQLHAEAAKARMAALVQRPRSHPLAAVRRRLVDGLAPIGAAALARGAHR